MHYGSLCLCFYMCMVWCVGETYKAHAAFCACGPRFPPAINFDDSSDFPLQGNV